MKHCYKSFENILSYIIRKTHEAMVGARGSVEADITSDENKSQIEESMISNIHGGWPYQN